MICVWMLELKILYPVIQMFMRKFGEEWGDGDRCVTEKIGKYHHKPLIISECDESDIFLHMNWKTLGFEAFGGMKNL